MPADGGTPQPLVVEPGHWLRHPDWSEKGLLYLRSNSSCDIGRIVVRSLDGGTSALAAVDDAGSPTWSPDGSAVAFIQGAGCNGKSTGLAVLRQGDRVPHSLDLPGLPGRPGSPAWGSR